MTDFKEQRICIKFCFDLKKKTAATFAYNPKMKLRLKGHRFDVTEDIHAESQEVIDTLTFENFQGGMKS